MQDSVKVIPPARDPSVVHSQPPGPKVPGGIRQGRPYRRPRPQSFRRIHRSACGRARPGGGGHLWARDVQLPIAEQRPQHNGHYVADLFRFHGPARAGSPAPGVSQPQPVCRSVAGELAEARDGKINISAARGLNSTGGQMPQPILTAVNTADSELTGDSGSA